MHFDPRRSWRDAIAFFDAGRYSESHKLLSELRKINPRHPQLLHLLGMCEYRMGDLQTAISLLRQAVAISPVLAPALSDLGNLLIKAGDTASAQAAYQKAVTADPGNSNAAMNLAHLRAALGESSAALEVLDKTLKHAPGAEYPIRWIRSLIALSYGKFEEGWRDYAVRWKLPATQFDSERHDFGLPPAAPSSAAPQAPVWLWREQGIGDEILYASTIGDALAQRWPIRLGCSQRLLTLFRRSFPELAIHPVETVRAADISECRSQLPLADLASALRRNSSSFGKGEAFLTADPVSQKRLRQKYTEAASGRRLVGLSWRSANRFSAAAKSPSLASFTPLLRRKDCIFVNLQYGPVDADLEEFRRHTGTTIIQDPSVDPLGDLDSFAAQIAALDAVVTVSNTTAHIAGALGVPCLVVLPAQDGLMWYWFRSGDQSLWYSSVVLLRQSTIGDWSTPINDVNKRLDNILLRPHPGGRTIR